MSFGNSYGGGRTRVGIRVYLNVYDLVQPDATTGNETNNASTSGMTGGGGGSIGSVASTTSSSGNNSSSNNNSNNPLVAMGCGLHHTGVEVMGTEYSFSNNGIFSGPPKMVAPNAQFREQIEMGVFEGSSSGGGGPGHSSSEIRRVVEALENDDGFGPGQYNLIKRNCNHFSNAMCWRLVGKTIPPHINRLADLGSCLSCLLPRSLLENAPVDGGNGDGSNNNRFAHLSSSSKQQEMTPIKAFSGTGAKLGGSDLSVPSSSSSQQNQDSGGLFHRVFGSTMSSTSSSNPSSTSDTDNLHDRREKARKAALARLEQQQQQRNQQKQQ